MQKIIEENMRLSGLSGRGRRESEVKYYCRRRVPD